MSAVNRSVTASLGICLGASTISVVEIAERDEKRKIVSRTGKPHLGDVRGTLRELLAGVSSLEKKRICVTGRQLRHSVRFSSISEPEAVELAVRHILPSGHPFRVIISGGGETFMVYYLDDSGCIQNIRTGNKCASGTGEFFQQQLRRMDISLESVSSMDIPENPFKVSGRCSVFCKSDCTHALNKGIPKESVVAGLTLMMADKLEELFKELPVRHVCLVGGCSKNKGLVHYLESRVDELLVPEDASFFEALGAACWALEHETLPFPGGEKIFTANLSRFSCHRPLKDFNHRVHFKTRPHGRAQSGDSTILGLDVGSTTTKGVIFRCSDRKILASSYQRTNGDPIRASRNVYRALAAELKVAVSIEGLGITGSGRQIAGLHGSATAVINEITAHATAAAFFDPEVDTILEIGGQDAKYTYLTNGVPNDYAMNEACSAGTGSFLEESAKESLGLDVREIGDVACRAENPPNFNDQCAAFIGSDIKNAVQQNISMEDIVAGLVYSVCMNYINRVKGNRPVGRKVFVQGGVCYNRAVPAAMASLTGREIVVPPDPGLMGAFGVALEVEKRIEQGLLEKGSFDLEYLADLSVRYGKSFTCGGGREKCDRKCEIALIKVGAQTYPFGGICNRYDNLAIGRKEDVSVFDLVARRQELVFGGENEENGNRPKVRMNRSFLVNTYFPFYRTYFDRLGFDLVLPGRVDPAGIARKKSSFCYPVEIAHGFVKEMLELEAEYTFLPHLKGIPSGESDTSCTCVFVQGEPYYLKSTFTELDSPRTLSPVIDFSESLGSNRKKFVEIARRLGCSGREGRRAFDAACNAQQQNRIAMKVMGEQFLAELEKNPEDIAVVLFGRPYNSFVPEANKGITLKFASRNVRIIPFDMLPYDEGGLGEGSNMYWAMGNMLMKCARFVRSHPQLFGTYITNFSCGPDSFVVTYFRDIMAQKPSLTLELDSHTADAGIETRIEAFLDIVASYRVLQQRPKKIRKQKGFTPAAMEFHGGMACMRRSSGELVPLTDGRIRVVLPAMSRFGTPLIAAVFSRAGIRAMALEPADEEVLKLGRGNSSCKECLPLQTTVGSILNYLEHDRPDGELTVYFMPSAPGPCRFGQYNVYTKRVISQHEFEDIAVFSPTSKNCYGGLGTDFSLAAWRGVVIGDLFDEMWATLLTAAVNREEALDVLDGIFSTIKNSIAGEWRELARQLKQAALELSEIELVQPYETIPKISLVGEIYVRHDPISLQQLVEKLASRGFIVRTAQNSEWFKYLDWLIKNGILGERSLSFWFGCLAKEKADAKIRRLLAPSGLFHNGDMRVNHVVKAGEKYISSQLRGEVILTVGSAFHDMLNPACGIISIGPFGCMPVRVAEAILNEKFKVGEKRKQLNGRASLQLPADDERKFPFLAIETDGNPFPQIIEARLEAFCLQAERLHREMLSGK
ncbi:acyl-CoA dehydratase activase [Desulfomarina sp.]